MGWDIPLHFDTNPESLRPFVPEIWPNNVFNLSATYDLDLWPKILKIFVSHGVPIRNMYAKFHNDRLRNGWDITLWNFAKTRTNKHTNTHTNKQTHTQTDMGITIPRPPPMGGEVIMIASCQHSDFKANFVYKVCTRSRSTQSIHWGLSTHNRLKSRGSAHMPFYLMVTLLQDEAVLVPVQVHLVSDSKLKRHHHDIFICHYRTGLYIYTYLQWRIQVFLKPL